MGRLEDIIERNQQPRRKRPAVAASAPVEGPTKAATAQVDRLTQIIERNKHPYRNHKLAVQIPAVLLLVVLGLLAFTNAAAPPVPEKQKLQRVHDVPMMRAPKAR